LPTVFRLGYATPSTTYAILFERSSGESSDPILIVVLLKISHPKDGREDGNVQVS